MIALAFAGSLLFASCTKPPAPPPPPALPPAAKDGSPVVGMVGETPVTFATLQVIAAQNGYNLQHKDEATLALRDAVNNEILASEAKKLGYEDDPEIRRYVKAQAVQKLLLATVDKDQRASAPTEAELREYYDKNGKEFTPPTLARGQVLALLKRKGQEPQFEQKLDAVKTAIETKQAPFSELVNQFTDDPAAKTYAGITNWLVKGDANKQYPDAVLQAVFEAKDTTAVVGPIEHNDWVYFVKLQARRDGQTSGFEQAKAKIGQQLQRKKRLDAYNQFVATLEKSVTVQTFPERVDAEIQANTKQSGPPMGPVRVAK